MKATIVVVYAAMAAWLLISSAARIAIQLQSGISIDALPFVSGAIGILAIVILVPAYEDWRGSR